MAFIKEWGDAKAIEGIGEKVPGAGADAEEEEEEEVELDVDILAKGGKEVEGSTITSMGMRSKRPVLEIYTDGSALKNGRVGAVAGVGVYFGQNDSR